MAISASGIGSGLDVNNIVDQLMQVERRPLTLLANKEASYQSQLSAFGQIKGAVSDFQTAANALKDATKFTATKTTVGSDAAFTASSTSKAAAGSYAVEVSQLAKTQRIATSASASEFVPAAGGLKVTFGTVDDSGGNFVADPTRTATLEFAGSSIEELRDAINANASLGIKASVINNGDKKQLVLNGTATGADKAFKIEGVEVAGQNGLAGLAYEPGVTGDMASIQKAQSAKLSIDGIAITRSNNTITDALEGVTLTLTKESATPVTSSLSVTNDRSAAKSAIDAFVKGYNDAVNTLKGLTAYNAENKQASQLTGDSTARNVQNQLRSLVSSSYPGLGNTSSLASIGVTLQKDGTLAVDSTKLDAALSDPKRDVTTFFAGKDGVKGFGAIVSSTLEGIAGTKGLIAGRSDGIKDTIKTLETQYNSLSTRLDAVEKRYRAQYTSLDSMISSMSQTQSFLSQQLASLASLR